MEFIIRDDEQIKPRPLRKQKKGTKLIIKRLGALEVGDRFELVYLKNDFRKLWIYSKSFTAIGVKGEKRNEETKEWLPFKSTFSGSATVRLLS